MDSQKAYSLKADDEEIKRAQRVAQLFNVPLKVFEYDKNLQETISKMVNIYGRCKIASTNSCS